MEGEIKLYKKAVKLTNKQVEKIMLKYCTDSPTTYIEKTKRLLKSKCTVKVDRTNLNKATIQWLNEELIIHCKEPQSCRLVIMSILTAKNYSHFYKNLHKKFKR